MTTADQLDIDEFRLDYIFIKFTSLAMPVLVPWIEVADGEYVHQESTVDEIVILTKKRNVEEEEGVVTEPVEDTPTKSHFKKEVLITYLDSKLRDASDPNIIDYGPIEDIRVQPAGQSMTKEVYIFLAKHGAV